MAGWTNRGHRALPGVRLATIRAERSAEVLAAIRARIARLTAREAIARRRKDAADADLAAADARYAERFGKPYDGEARP